MDITSIIKLINTLYRSVKVQVSANNYVKIDIKNVESKLSYWTTDELESLATQLNSDHKVISKLRMIGISPVIDALIKDKEKKIIPEIVDLSQSTSNNIFTLQCNTINNGDIILSIKSVYFLDFNKYKIDIRGLNTFIQSDDVIDRLALISRKDLKSNNSELYYNNKNLIDLYKISSKRLMDIRSSDEYRNITYNYISKVMILNLSIINVRASLENNLTYDVRWGCRAIEEIISILGNQREMRFGRSLYNRNGTAVIQDLPRIIELSDEVASIENQTSNAEFNELMRKLAVLSDITAGDMYNFIYSRKGKKWKPRYNRDTHLPLKEK